MNNPNYPRGGDNTMNDLGSPVYFPYYDGHGRGRIISRVQPVGILFHYDFEEGEYRNDMCVPAT